MIALRRDGVVVEVGDDLVMDDFEDAVVTWNNEFSGWDADGHFWSVRELPDVTEYRQEES